MISPLFFESFSKSSCVLFNTSDKLLNSVPFLVFTTFKIFFSALSSNSLISPVAPKQSFAISVDSSINRLSIAFSSTICI